MSFNQVSDKLKNARNIFCCGKGGVGKTSTAAALAVGFAAQKQKCLLISTDPAHSLADIFEQSIGPRPKKLTDCLTVLEIDEERAARDYMEEVKRNLLQFLPPRLFGRMEKQMDLALKAPGTLEAALSQCIAAHLDSPDYDRIIFDTAPTGHTLRLLSMPEVFSGWVEGLMSAQLRAKRLEEAAESLGGSGQVKIQGNPERDALVKDILHKRHEQLHQMRDILTDSKRSAFCLVMIPESLPVRESRRALESLRELHIKVSLLVVNRIMPAATEEGSFLNRRRKVESLYLEEINRIFDARIERIFLPLLDTDIRGLDMLRNFFDTAGKEKPW
ncbi:MAG: hypothetical protein B0D92_02305 [Spirochaeta sp. LUC14_002_19_P3]|nr:MAG: hypothetical protein B0D92_02305 [Spirochaeta sp. LUC14_002_19_P3]